MRAIYIADDGKQFNDKWECEEYERTAAYSKMNHLIRGLDAEGKKMFFSQEDFCEAVFTLYIASKEAVDIFVERSAREGLSNDGIEEPGTYVWDDENLYGRGEGWVDVSEVLEYLKNLELNLRNKVEVVLNI